MINNKLLKGAAAAGGIVPSENFRTIIYTGNTEETRTIPLGIDADFVWLKRRDAAFSHFLTDSVRGGSDPMKAIFSNAANAQYTTTSEFNGYGYIKSLSGSNLVVVQGTQASGSNTNHPNATYVIWVWKAGGAKALNEEGTIDSQVSANTAAGFSVVSYTGNNTAGATIGHGLSSAPELIIQKRTEASANWFVYSSGIGNTKYLVLDANIAASDAANVWNNTNPTNEVFTVSDFGDVNGANISSIAYCFHSVAEYSKVGTYEGTFLAGNDVECGFEPAWVMIKNADATGNWIIVDNKRNPTNERNKFLYPNDSAAEGDLSAYDTIDFTTTGFVLQDHTDLTGNTNINVSGQTYIFYAVAADPDTTTPTLAKSFDIHTYTGNGGTQSIGSVNTLFTKYAVFNGSSSYISTALTPTVANLRTVSLWFKTNASAFGVMQSVGPYGVGNGYTWEWIYMLADGKIGAGYGANNGGSVYMKTTSASYNDGSWHHIVLTLNGVYGSGSLVDVYIDGQQPSTTIDTLHSGAISTIEGTVVIGAKKIYANPANLFNGAIDQLRIYNTVLNQTAVTSLYNETQASASTKDYPSGLGCLALYEFTDNAETTPSSSYDGTAYNVTYDSFLFKPDLVLIKNRDFAVNWRVYDTVRGVEDKFLSTNNATETGSVANYLLHGGISSFNNAGFTATCGTDGTYQATNKSGQDYVAYSFKMLDNNNNVPIENEVGTIDSLVSANPSAGMSIVKYTGTGSAGTVGHGLSSATGPDMVIIKNLDDTRNWVVWHKDLSASNYILLNSTNAQVQDTRTNGGQARPFGPFTSTTFGVNLDNETGHTNNYIAYCFHSVAGFSKFGSYVGDASTKNITLGFEPSFIMLKSISSGAGNNYWTVFDNKRNTSNPRTCEIYLNSADISYCTEGTAPNYRGLNFTSTGIQLLSTSYNNENGVSFIYWAMKIN